MTMTNASLVERAQNGKVRDDDPAAKPARRRFTDDYKRRILEEYQSQTDPGAKGALLRREGLYSSQMVEWRRAQEAGEISPPALTHRKKRTASRAGAREAAQAQRPPRGPAGQPQAGLGDPGKSIGALGPAAGRECGHRDRAAAVIDEAFAS